MLLLAARCLSLNQSINLANSEARPCRKEAEGRRKKGGSRMNERSSACTQTAAVIPIYINRQYSRTRKPVAESSYRSAA